MRRVHQFEQRPLGIGIRDHGPGCNLFAIREHDAAGDAVFDANQVTAEVLCQMLRDKYTPMTGNPGRVSVLSPTEVDALVKECAETDLNKAFLDKSYADVAAYRAAQR